MSSARGDGNALLITGILGFLAGSAVAYQMLARRKEDAATVVERVISQRRTVQAAYFAEQDKNSNNVSRQQIERLLEAANWAPTHGKTEPWRFVIFQDEASRRALGEKDAAIYKSLVKPELFSEKKYNKKINAKVQSSHVICLCMKRQESKKIPLEEEQMAVACAVQNMHLLGSAMGLGCCWLSGPTVRTTEMKQYLKLESPEDECLGFFCVGIPDPKKFSPKPQRKPVQEKTQWI